jgi:dihydrolipoamide dehydrogenase
MQTVKTDIVVIGAGPGGYAAAFYAADLGKNVVLIERASRLGGVCLNHGCIPSKALLHATHQIKSAQESARRGIHFARPRLELQELRDWKNCIVKKLADGVSFLAQKRGVTVLTGSACFENSNRVCVNTAQGLKTVEFDHAIIATGSRAVLPSAFDLGIPQVMTSTEALEVETIPAKLLVIGGGYIGMEMGFIYSGLGSEVVVAEALGSILAGADPDLVRLVAANATKSFKAIRLNAKIGQLKLVGNQVNVETQQADGSKVEELFDRVLVAIGRSPNSADLGLEHTGVQLDTKLFIKTNARRQTDDPSIYAIGDVAGGVLLAHKAHQEARTAVNAITGHQVDEAGKTEIPAVVFTDPELAWVGLTEAEAHQQGIRHEVAKFPWAACGRAVTFGRTDGLTKMLIDPTDERVLGVGIAGSGAGELIAEAALAMKMRAKARDLATTVHPHPTISETMMECAETFYGHATHLINRKRI